MTGESLKIITAGATREGLDALVGSFRRQSGIGVDWTTDHGHNIRKYVIAGETDADMVLLPTAMVEDLRGRGLVADRFETVLGVIRVGAAVRAGQALPDVSTMDALRQTLERARSVVITEAPSGVHMQRVFAQLGLAAALEPRIVRYDTGTMVNEHLVASDAEREIAFGVATEIRFFRDKGVAYAGPIPEEVQMAAEYRAAMLSRCGKPEAARALLDFLGTPEARRAFAESGVDAD